MRRADWTDRLWQVVAAASGRPFEWGAHDCCTFAATAIDAMCDTDYREQLAAHYHDRTTAAAFIEASGGIELAVSSFLGDLRPGLPQRGDIALVETQHGRGVGVALGTTIAVPGDAGLEQYPIGRALGHWRT